MNRATYALVPHTADICIEVNAKALRELFLNSATALTEQIVKTKKASKKETREIEIAAPDMDSLLIYWLQELLYNFYVHGLVYVDARIRVLTVKKLKVNAVFCRFRPEKHVALREVKAVTYHNVHIKKMGGRYMVRIVLDI